MERKVSITINDQLYESTVEIRLLLVDFIREVAQLTGTHVGCSVEGRCGACTVILDGRQAKSCLMLAVQADGSRILTVEGLTRRGRLHPIQEAFWEKHALQCGFCTPGQMMAIYEFLKSPKRADEKIREAVRGILCPCTGYVHIIEAVKAAIDKLDAMAPEERQGFFPL